MRGLMDGGRRGWLVGFFKGVMNGVGVSPGRFLFFFLHGSRSWGC